MDHNPLPDQKPGLTGFKETIAFYDSIFPDSDVTSREDGIALREAIPSPWGEDRPDSPSPDQGAVLFDGAGSGDAAGSDGGLVFDRGGELFARLMRVHFEVIDEVRK